MNVFESILDLLYPPCCGLCGELLPDKTSLCRKCQSSIPQIEEPSCIYCGKSIIGTIEGQNICIECSKDTKYYTKLICCYEYDGIIREKLIKYKFNDDCYLYKTFAEILYNRLKHFEQLNSIDYIITVPMHKIRKRERGYDQLELIAKEISKKAKIPYIKDVLYKNTNTLHQSQLDKAKRKNNLKDAFKITNKNKIYAKNLLLIDDIITTGSTINECSKLLYMNNAKNIYGAVIATGKNQIL